MDEVREIALHRRAGLLVPDDFRELPFSFPTFAVAGETYAMANRDPRETDEIQEQPVFEVGQKIRSIPTCATTEPIRDRPSVKC